jgi:hypothetical protein
MTTASLARDLKLALDPSQLRVGHALSDSAWD